MFAIVTWLFGWLASGPLDRILTSIDHKVDNETERERIKEVVAEYLKAQTAISSGRGWWFPLLFLVPAGLWFASVWVYSILWCWGCIYPQNWLIAALPPPLDQWMGAIVASLFIGKIGGELVARLRRQSRHSQGCASPQSPRRSAPPCLRGPTQGRPYFCSALQRS